MLPSEVIWPHPLPAHAGLPEGRPVSDPKGVEKQEQDADIAVW